MKNDFNYEEETRKHQKRVIELMSMVTEELNKRASVHDESKFIEPERSLLEAFTHRLADSSYGSEEYEQMKRDLKPALDHHYSTNSHHPEHYENGIDGMSLFDIVELFVDWKASSERHNDGNIYKSLDINKDRFKMSDQLVQIFINTAKRMNF